MTSMPCRFRTFVKTAIGTPGQIGDVGLAFVRLVVQVIAALVLVFAGAASAATLDLEMRTCTGGARSAQEAFALSPESLDCGGARFERGERFVRTHAKLLDSPFAINEPLIWRTDPSTFTSMLLQFTFADGSRRLVDVDPQMAARNWVAGNRFFVPIPASDASLVEVDAVIERPHTRATMRNAQIADEPSASREHFLRSLVYVFLCGLLVVPIVYDLLFYRALRARFMAWHLAMTVSIFAYVLSSSGLTFVIFPDLALQTRWQLNTVALSLTIAASVMFAIGLLEDEVMPQVLLRAVVVSTAVMLSIKLIALFEFEAFRIAIVPWYTASIIPIALAMVAALAVGLARKSRAAVFLTIAFSGLIVSIVLHLVERLAIADVAFSLDDMLYVSMVILALGTSAGAGDRFMVLRAQRDEARSQAARLGQMANTDGLTGLLNRRAFDQIETLEQGRGLLLADIDRFKPINDRHGHQVGDAVLCHAARLLRSGMEGQPRARVYRLGGEEFAVVVDIDDDALLGECAEHLRRIVEEQSGREGAVELPAITISIGGVQGRGQSIREAMAQADKALYRAKDEGRNRVVMDHSWGDGGTASALPVPAL